MPYYEVMLQRATLITVTVFAETAHDAEGEAFAATQEGGYTVLQETWDTESIEEMLKPQT